MNNSSSLPTINELLAAIQDEVARRYALRSEPTNGAVLAEFVRARYPTLTYTALGVARLADIIRLGEEQGLLVRNRNVKHLEVFPPSVSAREIPVRAGQRARTDGPIRRELWQALMFFHPNEVYLVDRETGSVAVVQEKEVAGFDSARWVKVDTIPAEVQKGWMRSFVDNHPAAVGIATAIEASDWYTAFPTNLRIAHPELTRAWATERTRCVIDYLRQWSEEHKVPLSTLLTPSLPTGSATGAGQTHTPSVPGPQRPAVETDREEETLLRAVMATLHDMTLEELLALSLPLRRLVRHFKPR